MNAPRIRPALAITAALAALVALTFAFVPSVQFVVGGALVNVGYRLQDHLHAFDFKHDEHLDAEAVWREVKRHNAMASAVREFFPRSVEHPVIALLACMDARIDTAELMGDTRRYYYVVRTAGSVLAPPEQEMLELAVKNGVRVIALTTHSDCAAERAAKSPELRAQFPEMVSLVDQREQRIAEFKARPAIRAALASGKLAIHRAHIDTETDRLFTID